MCYLYASLVSLHFESLNALGLLRASEDPWEALRPKCIFLMDEIGAQHRHAVEALDQTL